MCLSHVVPPRETVRGSRAVLAPPIGGPEWNAELARMCETLLRKRCPGPPVSPTVVTQRQLMTVFDSATRLCSTRRDLVMGLRLLRTALTLRFVVILAVCVQLRKSLPQLSGQPSNTERMKRDQ